MLAKQNLLNIFPTQTMTTDRVQLHSLRLIEKANAVSASNYLKFIKMTEHALNPTLESARSAGFTLRSPYDTTLPAERKEVIMTSAY